MADFFNLAMLTLASIGALLFGVLSAYAILRTAFALMGRERRSLALKAQPEISAAN